MSSSATPRVVHPIRASVSVTREQREDATRRLAAAIRAQMGREQITGSELARRLGWTQSATARRVRGDLELTIWELDAMAAALGTTAAALRDDAEDAA